MGDELTRLRTENYHLRIALKTRDVIGQAKGILMERHGLDADEAFDRLTTMSQDANIKLRDVAEHLVELRADLAAAEDPTLVDD